MTANEPAALILPSRLRDDVVSHAAASYPREVVGLLGGTAAGDVNIVLPLRNLAPGAKAFLADPYDQYRALRYLESRQAGLLAIFHSHPAGGVDPSDEDLGHAQRWRCAHVIVAIDAAGLARFRAFTLSSLGAMQHVAIRISRG